MARDEEAAKEDEEKWRGERSATMEHAAGGWISRGYAAVYINLAPTIHIQVGIHTLSEAVRLVEWIDRHYGCRTEAGELPEVEGMCAALRDPWVSRMPRARTTAGNREYAIPAGEGEQGKYMKRCGDTLIEWTAKGKRVRVARSMATWHPIREHGLHVTSDSETTPPPSIEEEPSSDLKRNSTRLPYARIRLSIVRDSDIENSSRHSCQRLPLMKKSVYGVRKYLYEKCLWKTFWEKI